MSRAYRIRVRESLSRVIHGKDHVSSQLEILEILPAGEMAELIAEQLVQRGFERQANTLTREEDGLTILVDVSSGLVTVSAEDSEQIELELEKEGLVFEEQLGQRDKHQEGLRNEVRAELESKASQEEAMLNQQATDRLERHLGEIRRELDQAVNSATAEALKQKAAQLGEIKELREDVETGSLTIVVEV